MRNLRVLLALSLGLVVVCFFVFEPLAAQTPASNAAASHGCSAHKEPPSPGDVAFAQHDFAKAIEFYTEEAKSPGWDGTRAHDSRIRIQLSMGKIPEADTDAAAWVKSSPSDSFAMLAEAEVQWREGHLAEGLTGTEAVLKADSCNARAHADYAGLLSMTAMYASAKKHIDFAHRLSPTDREIAREWAPYQTRGVQLQDISNYLATSTTLNDKQRASLERRKDRLSEPPAGACRLAAAVDSTSIPFRTIQASGPQGHSVWGLEVQFNGQKRSLEIDTGAHGFLLSKVAAEGLNLKPIAHTASHGIGDEGVVGSYIAKVASLRIGGLEFKDCDVEVLDKNGRGVMEGSTGLIGGDVFSQFLVTLDFPGKTLKLDPLPQRPGETAATNIGLDTGTDEASTDIPRDAYRDLTMDKWTAVFRIGHDLLVPVSVNATPKRLFLVDTGAGISAISTDFARMVTKVSDDSDIEVYGISGKVAKTLTTGKVTLDFGGLRQPQDSMIAMNTGSISNDAGIDVAGILGVFTLHQLTLKLDYRDDLVQFLFDPKRLQPCAEGIAQTDCY